MPSIWRRQLKWKFETKSRITSSPAAAGGKVYFESYEGTFTPWKRQRSNERWKFADSRRTQLCGQPFTRRQPASGGYA